MNTIKFQEFIDEVNKEIQSIVRIHFDVKFLQENDGPAIMELKLLDNDLIEITNKGDIKVKNVLKEIMEEKIKEYFKEDKPDLEFRD